MSSAPTSPWSAGRCALVIVVGGLSACSKRDKPTEPFSEVAPGSISLAPAHAAPYEFVEVTGLPTDFTRARVTVTVGEARTVLSVSSTTQRVGVVVPPGVSVGDARVRIAAVGAPRAFECTVRVVETVYADGSPDAAVANLAALSDSLSATVRAAASALDTGSAPYLVSGFEVVEAVLAGVQRETATLSPGDRAQVAALYSVYEPRLRALRTDLAAVAALTPPRQPSAAARRRSLNTPSTLAASRDIPPAPGRVGMLSSRSYAPANDEDIVDRCEAHLDRLQKAKAYGEYSEQAAAALALVALAPIPQAKAAARILTAAAMLSKAYYLYLNDQPALFDPNGLTLLPYSTGRTVRLADGSSAIVAAGEAGAIEARVKLRSAGQFTGATLQVVTDVLNVYKRVLGEVGEVVQNVVKTSFPDVEPLNKAAEWLDESGVGDTGLGKRDEADMPFARIRLVKNTAQSAWEFTADPLGPSRPFVTKEVVSEAPVLAVTLGAITTGGAAEPNGQPGCLAETDAARTDPAQWVNGFLIAVPPRLVLGRPNTPLAVQVEAGKSATLTVPVANLWSGTMTALSFTASGLPSGVTVTVASSPPSLEASASGQVVLTVSAAATAPTGTGTFRVSAYGVAADGGGGLETSGGVDVQIIVANGQSLLPLALGNRWVYKAVQYDVDGTKPVTCTHASTVTAVSEAWATVVAAVGSCDGEPYDNIDASTAEYANRADGLFVRFAGYSPASGTLYLRYPAAVGDTYTFQVAPTTAGFTVAVARLADDTYQYNFLGPRKNGGEQVLWQVVTARVGVGITESIEYAYYNDARVVYKHTTLVSYTLR